MPTHAEHITARSRNNKHRVPKNCVHAKSVIRLMRRNELCMSHRCPTARRSARRAPPVLNASLSERPRRCSSMAEHQLPKLNQPDYRRFPPFTAVLAAVTETCPDQRKLFTKVCDSTCLYVTVWRVSSDRVVSPSCHRHNPRGQDLSVVRCAMAVC